jgi:hypothetical protein
MTDQRAAKAVGLNPAHAAYIKSKPCVRAYMLELQQIVEQEAEGLHRFHVGREQVLDRLLGTRQWALKSPEAITGQVKAMSMIVAIEGLIPDGRAGSAEKKPAPPPTNAYIYPSASREQRAETAGPQSNLAHDQEDQEAQEEDGHGVSEAEPDPGESTFASETQSIAPDTRVPFAIKKNLFSRRR